MKTRKVLSTLLSIALIFGMIVPAVPAASAARILDDAIAIEAPAAPAELDAPAQPMDAGSFARAGESMAIPQFLMAATASSEESSATDNRAVNALDGNPGTIWHTRWTGGNAPAPHHLSYGLVAGITLAGLYIGAQL